MLTEKKKEKGKKASGCHQPSKIRKKLKVITLKEAKKLRSKIMNNPQLIKSSHKVDSCGSLAFA